MKSHQYEHHSTKLSLAVFILDDYTGKNAIGRVNVSLKGQEEKPVKPVKNPSSYYLFLNLPEQNKREGRIRTLFWIFDRGRNYKRRW